MGYKEEFCHGYGGETDCPEKLGMPHHWKIQNGQGFEQHNLVKDIPACGTGVGLNDLKVFLPTQTIL